jgi:hypothetical protein
MHSQALKKTARIAVDARKIPTLGGGDPKKRWHIRVPGVRQNSKLRI